MLAFLLAGDDEHDLVEEGDKNEQVFKTDVGGNDRYLRSLPSVQALHHQAAVT